MSLAYSEIHASHVHGDSASELPPQLDEPAVKKLRTLAIVGGIALVILGAVLLIRPTALPVALITLFINVDEPEYSARFYPPETLAYAWVNLLSDEIISGDALDIWEQLNDDPVFKNSLDDFEVQASDETEIDFREDVIPWIGPEISAGLLGVDPRTGEPLLATLIGVRDRDAAEDFMIDFRDYFQDEFRIDFDAAWYRDNIVWIDEERNVSYALTDDWLVFANDEGALASVLHYVTGDDDDSLANTERFETARANLPDDRFISAYVAGQETIVRFGGDSVDEIEYLLQFIPEWVAMSGDWVDRGLVVEAVWPTIEDLGVSAEELDEPAQVVPDDAMVFIAGSIDMDMDHWRATLSEYRLSEFVTNPRYVEEIDFELRQLGRHEIEPLVEDATVADLMDMGLDAISHRVGTDFEDGLLRHLTGEVAVAFRDFDDEWLYGYRGIDDVPYDATAHLRYRGRSNDDLEGTMSKLASWVAAEAQSNSNRVLVEVERGSLIPGLALGDWLRFGQNRNPGYVVHDEYLTLATDERELRTTVSVQDGDDPHLASSDHYRRATSHLPSKRHYLGFVDATSMYDVVEEEADFDPRINSVMRNSLDAFAVSLFFGEEHTRLSSVLTLFPE